MEDAAPPRPEGRGFRREETMKYEEVAPTLSKYLTLEEVRSHIAKDAGVVESTVPQLSKDTVLQAMQYIRYLGAEMVPIEDKEYVTMGPRDICNRLAKDGHDITPNQIKELYKEFRKVKSLPDNKVVEPIKPVEPVEPIDVKDTEPAPDWEKN